MTPEQRFRAARWGYVAVVLLATLTQLHFSSDLTAAGERLVRAFTPSLGWRDAIDGLRNTVLFAGLGAVWVVTSRSGNVRAERDRRGAAGVLTSADRQHRGCHDQHAGRAAGRGRGRPVDRGRRGGEGSAVVPGRADLPRGRRVRRGRAVRGADALVRAGRAAVDRRWTPRAPQRRARGGGTDLVRHAAAGRPAAVRAGRISLRHAAARTGA